jgi:hypothetical protein
MYACRNPLMVLWSLLTGKTPPAPPYRFHILNSHFFTDECPEPQDPNPVPSIELQPGDDINEVASRLPGMTWAQVLESTADQPE